MQDVETIGLVYTITLKVPVMRYTSFYSKRGGRITHSTFYTNPIDSHTQNADSDRIYENILISHVPRVTVQSADEKEENLGGSLTLVDSLPKDYALFTLLFHIVHYSLRKSNFYEIS